MTKLAEQHSGTIRRRTAPLALLPAALIAALAAPAATAKESAAGLAESPAGQILVVDANLAEAFQAVDVSDPTDMENFADRVTEQVPYAPDVLVLQEVIGPSAATVARAISEETGFRYEVAVAPGPSHVVKPATPTTPELRRDTAIVLNADTMRVLDDGGRIDISYAAEDHASGTWMTKQEPYLLAQELHGGLRSPLLSLHFVPNSRLTSAAVGFEYKAQWSRQIVNLLETTYPSPANRQVEIFGGDFNNRPCVERNVAATEPECTPMPYWEALTDLGYAPAQDDGIDNIFTTGSIVASGADTTRKTAIGTDAEFQDCKALFTAGRGQEATGFCGTEFYADHNFLWAVVGMPIGEEAGDSPAFEAPEGVRSARPRVHP